MNRAALPLVGTVLGLVVVLTYRTPAVTAATAVTATAPAANAAAPAGATTRTLTGAVTSTRWGPVQVAVVLTGGRITQVQVLQQPDANSRDREIAAYALPRLTAQTVTLQSAQVDTVSGATYTSQGYRTSLQSALDQR